MRRRIVLFAAGAALLAVVLLAIPLGVLAGHGYLRDERLELQQAAATAAAQARGDVTAAATAPRIDGREIQTTVYDTNGRRTSGAGPPQASPIVQAALAGRQATATKARTIAVAAPVSDGDQVVAALLLTTDLDAVHARTAHAWLALAGMCAAAVAVSALGALMLARRLTHPLDRLASVADRVGAGDLTARAESSGIAEIDTLAETLNDTVTRVEAMIGSERAFSAEVSHQLRTPLSGLRLELEAAAAALDASGAPGMPANDARERVRRSLDAVDRLAATITDVISLARDLPSGAQTDLATLLDGVVNRWRGPLAAASRPLRIETDEGVPDTLSISSAAATQILEVLLDNATRHGSGAITLRVAAGEDQHTVGVHVSDEGPALPTEAWQLFRRQDGDGADSHGIGLPYARRLAEAEGARLVLGAEHPPTFVLIVPVPFHRR